MLIFEQSCITEAKNFSRLITNLFASKLLLYEINCIILYDDFISGTTTLKEV